MRTGDRVYHRPSGETWLVAAVWPDRDDMAWCGWPDGLARMSDCDLVRACDDEAHWKLVEQIAKGATGTRARYCQDLLATRPLGLTPATPAAPTELGRVMGRGIGSGLPDVSEERSDPC